MDPQNRRDSILRFWKKMDRRLWPFKSCDCCAEDDNCTASKWVDGHWYCLCESCPNNPECKCFRLEDDHKLEFAFSIRDRLRIQRDDRLEELGYPPLGHNDGWDSESEHSSDENGPDDDTQDGSVHGPESDEEALTLGNEDWATESEDDSDENGPEDDSQDGSVRGPESDDEAPALVTSIGNVYWETESGFTSDENGPEDDSQDGSLRDPETDDEALTLGVVNRSFVVNADMDPSSEMTFWPEIRDYIKRRPYTRCCICQMRELNIPQLPPLDLNSSEPSEEPWLLKCGHVVGRDCYALYAVDAIDEKFHDMGHENWDLALSEAELKCPICRQDVDKSDLPTLSRSGAEFWGS